MLLTIAPKAWPWQKGPGTRYGRVLHPLLVQLGQLATREPRPLRDAFLQCALGLLSCDQNDREPLLIPVVGDGLEPTAVLQAR
jgi:hypothetical protein